MSLLSWAIKNKQLSLSIVIASVGILLLLIGSAGIKPIPLSIGEFSLAKEGSYVSLSGIIRSIAERSNGYTLTVCESSGSSRCVVALLSRSSIESTVLEGDFIYLSGTARAYNGQMYLMVNSLSEVAVIPSS